MTPGERWLAATWPLVRSGLPPLPARVVDVGCGPLGGYVPLLRAAGYDAFGIDPEAPEGALYRRIEFERADLPRDIDALVASRSLHHVTDPTHVIDQLSGALRSGGALVVVEWAWEVFDEQTAHWCFERLRPDDAGWLQRRRDEWRSSGREWPRYLRNWAERERLHSGEVLVRSLEERFERRLLAHGPYFFPDLVGVTQAAEQEAIDADQIQPGRIDYIGTPR